MTIPNATQAYPFDVAGFSPVTTLAGIKGLLLKTGCPDEKLCTALARLADLDARIFFREHTFEGATALIVYPVEPVDGSDPQWDVVRNGYRVAWVNEQENAWEVNGLRGLGTPGPIASFASAKLALEYIAQAEQSFPVMAAVPWLVTTSAPSRRLSKEEVAEAARRPYSPQPMGEPHQMVQAGAPGDPAEPSPDESPVGWTDAGDRGPGPRDMLAARIERQPWGVQSDIAQVLQRLSDGYHLEASAGLADTLSYIENECGIQMADLVKAVTSVAGWQK